MSVCLGRWQHTRIAAVNATAKMPIGCGCLIEANGLGCESGERGFRLEIHVKDTGLRPAMAWQVVVYSYVTVLHVVFTLEVHAERQVVQEWANGDQLSG